jgi:hypothetical protein
VKTEAAVQCEGAQANTCPYQQIHPSRIQYIGIDLWPAKALWPRSKAPEQTKASAMPGDKGFRFDDNQNVASCGPKPAHPTGLLFSFQTKG